MNPTRSNPISRRRFSKITAAISTLGASPMMSQAATTAGKNWIDAHAHVWHPDTERYPISPNFQHSDMQPPSFTDSELLAHCMPSGVNRVVLIQMSFYEYDHRYMTEVMQQHPGVFSGVSLINWKQNRLRAEVKRHAKMGMRGFRMHSRGDAKTWPNDKEVHMLWRAATRHDMAICPLINPEDLSAIHALCKKFPETKVVIDHFARIGVSGVIEPDRLNELCQLAQFPNTHVKTSAFYALGRKTPPYQDLIPMIQKVVDAFGTDRLMWASDCPYQVQPPHDYESSVELITKHATFLTESEKESIMRKTAERLFFG